VKDEALQKLMSSVRQAGRIRRGTLKAARTTVFKPQEVKAVRASLGASQSEFALMIGVSVATVQNWEQGRRTPDGPALALLRVAARNPKAVADVMRIARSIPDRLFKKLDHVARQTGRSRSGVLSAALVEYVARHAPDDVTEAMNRVCADADGQPDAFVTAAGRRVLERTEWSRRADHS
jgi:putative transcriptional regulator